MADWGVPTNGAADTWGGGNDNAATNGDAWGSGGDHSTNGGGEAPAPVIDDAESKQKREEFKEKAREKGWTEKTAFDYSEFQRTGGDRGGWGGAAAKYEWKEEYGDVAPRVPELEVQLFGGEFRMRRGDHSEQLEFEVDVEAGEKFARINKVSPYIDLA